MTCPNCGYCSHCGHVRYQFIPAHLPWLTYPSYPTYPNMYPTITWNGGTVNCDVTEAKVLPEATVA